MSIEYVQNQNNSELWTIQAHYQDQKIELGSLHKLRLNLGVGR